jgi:carbonic anhydrase
VTPEALRRTEQRAVVLQLERLMDYPMVRTQVEAGKLALHGWHYVIEDGEVHVFDVASGRFIAASQAAHSGTGPYELGDAGVLFNEIDDAFAPR